jgi:hypothetical protein
MRQSFLLVAFAYAVFLIAAWIFERSRSRRNGPDAISLFVVLFLLQCALPGVAIYGLLPLVDDIAPTTVPVIDRILVSTDLVTAFAVLLLTVWFLIFFYVGCSIAKVALPPLKAVAPAYTVNVDQRRILAIVVGGFLLALYSFMLLGDTWLTRYVNLILFRGGQEEIERNALNANAFALTQTWSWLSVLALLTIREHRGRRALWWLCLTLAICLAVLGVSRRSLFLPLVLAYLAFVVHGKRWYLAKGLVAAVPLVLIVAFGKDLLAAIAFSGNPLDVASTYETTASALLRASSEIGLNIVESLGTLQFIHMPPRFGVDHILAIAQRFPEGMLGLAFEFPQRIVRISTETFGGVNYQDIPPGLAGQMWLDFRILGPVIWGLLFGFQIGLVQYLFSKTRNTLAASAVLGVVVFIVALPLTTGSFDFTFSVDMIVLVIALWWSVRVIPVTREQPAPLAAFA